MTDINKSALVPYSAGQMYALVDDIESYEDFLPWCQASRELLREENIVEGRLEIALGKLHKAFTTRNLLKKDAEIEMQLIEGPFKRLHGVWRFEPLGEEGSKVSLHLEFEFSNKLLSMTFGSVFGHIANSLVDSFTQRAQQVYGNG